MSDEATVVAGTGLPADGDDRDSDVRVLRGADHPVLDDLASDREVGDEDDSPEWDVEEYARQQYRDCWGDEPSDNRVEWLQQQMNTLWTGQRLLDHSAHKALESLQWHQSCIDKLALLEEDTSGWLDEMDEQLAAHEARIRRIYRQNAVIAAIDLVTLVAIVLFMLFR